MSKGRKVAEKKKLLLIADFPHDTGFGVVATNLLKHWEPYYDIYVLGVNYYGDYHPLAQKYKAYPASTGGDIYGINRLPELLNAIQPEHIFVINDIWIAKEYTNILKEYRVACDKINKPVKMFLYTPVDAINIKSLFVQPCNGVFDIVFPYTQFGEDVLRQSGLTTDTMIVPHGVDTTFFKPMGRLDARILLNLPQHAYIVLMNARNSPRKRIDLGFYYFSEWVKRFDLPDNVLFYYHGSLHDPGGYDIMNLANAFGMRDRLILSSADMTPGALLPREHLVKMYASANVFWMTTTGEGWCLPAAEAMACRIPCLLPNHSAFAEWAKPGAMLYDCSSIYTQINQLNTIHMVPDKEAAITKLQELYQDDTLRKELGMKGYNLVQESRFRWENIARTFYDAMNKEDRHGTNNSTPD
jgi:D-inositol-3-phosphate glycosyltransferase